MTKKDMTAKRQQDGAVPASKKRRGLKLFRQLVWGVFSLCLLTVIVTTITLQLFLFWLNSQSGSDWLAQKLAAASRNTGYQVVLQDFRLHGPYGVRAAYVGVADERGIFVTAKNLDLRLNIFPLALRHLSVNIDAASLDLLRLPQAQIQENAVETVAFKLQEKPNIYFHTLSLDLRLPHLALSPAVVPGGLTLGLESVQKLSLSDAPELTGVVVLENPQGTAAPYLPEQLAYRASGQWNSTSLKLENARVQKSRMYVFDLAGGYDGGGQIFDVLAKGAIRQELRSEIGQEVRVELSATGKTDAAEGVLKLAGQMADEEISATLPFVLHDDLLELPSLAAQFPGITAEGALVLNRETQLADGQIKLTAAHFGLVETLFGVDGLQGSGAFSLTLTHPQDVQKITGQARLQDMQYGSTSVKNAKIDVAAQEGGRHHIGFVFDGYDHAPFKAEGSLIADLARQGVVLEKTHVTLGKGTVDLSGSAGMEKLALEAALDNITPDALPFVTLESYPAKITSGKVTLAGTPQMPELTVSAQIAGRMRHVRDAGVTVDGHYKNGAAEVALTAKGQGIRSFEGVASVPVSLSLYPFVFDLSQSAQITGGAKGDFDLEQVVAPFLAAGQDLSGAVKLDASLSGSLTQPVYGGGLVLSQAAFRDSDTGIILKDIKGDLHFDQTGVVLKSLTATDGGTGRMSMTGTIGTGAGRDIPDVTAQVILKGMHLVRATHASSMLSGDVSVLPQRGRYLYLVKGDVSLDTVLITLPERFEKSIPSLNIVTKETEKKTGMLDRVALDLTLKADHKVFVRGWGLDAELKGALAVKGTLEEPDVRGTLGLVRGRYEELGKTFNILRADLRFQGTIPPSPYLDILTETKAGDIKPRIGITGTAEAPQITITSDPPRPQDEVIAQLLFGRDATQISPFQAVQLASAIRRLTTGERSGFDPVGDIRSAAGLDDLRVGGDAEGGVTVGAGKYVTDKVYLEAETGSGEAGGAAKIQIELTPDITVESKTGTTGTTGVGVFWKRDY
ncbi:MAG: hypothetical protein EP349_01425 [Alphaproteobacteria bacterium]|nr:MAG: hypothetical protein EP349_01425 [Alphaproteobacteria bacterium]